jgi:hypothetical protein
MSNRAVRHRRIGPGLEVALCGWRGIFGYANTQRYVTCTACKAKYAGLRGTNRMVDQLAAKREHDRAKYARGVGGVV